jgi:hypothetical protein
MVQHLYQLHRHLVEDTLVVADLTAPAEDATIVAPTLSTLAEDTTSLAAHPTAAVEDTIIVAPVPLTLAEDATKVAVARSALAEDDATIATAPTAPAEDSSMAAAALRSSPRALVPSWLLKLGCRSQCGLDNTSHGVEVPAGIGKLTTLVSFGVANVGTRDKEVILKELHMLTQLSSLAVCGRWHYPLRYQRPWKEALSCVGMYTYSKAAGSRSSLTSKAWTSR